MGTLRGSGKNKDSSATIPISTITDVSGSRALDGTVYTNTTTKTMIVLVSIHTNTAAGTDSANINLYSPDTLWNAQVGVGDGLAAHRANLQAIMFVRPGDTYKITTSVTAGGSVTLVTWVEVT